MIPQWLGLSADQAGSSVGENNYTATWVCFCMRLASCVDVSVCVHVMGV